ncbi:solute carrier organic anion transporter family member 2A1-like [Amphiura filiformis]|uniref:solute carrier organic anion transporter family member 2A1-like n=1 Tax=Amphiura filiformis TaxID=82378 RepID=UPI003B21A253
MASHNTNDKAGRYEILNGTPPPDETSTSAGTNNDNDALCGCGPYKLQVIVGPKLFTFNAGLLFGIYIGMSSYLHSILTQIERQFELSSSEVGSLVVTNDVTILCLVIFASYFGHNSHRPRWLGGGGLLIALGLLICSMPHFMSDPVDPSSILVGGGTGRGAARNTGFCKSMETSANLYGLANQSNQSSNDSQPQEHGANYINMTQDMCEGELSKGMGLVKWLLLGQVLIGIGAAPAFPLTISYLDDCVQKHELTTYTAFMLIFATMGPIAGLMLGSRATSFYVDFDRVDANLIPDIPQYDPRWLGAWWLGFLVSGGLLVIIAIPLFFYPKRMPKPKDVGKPERLDEVDNNNDDGDDTLGDLFKHQTGNSDNIGVINAIKGILSTVKRLLSNTSLIILILAGACDMASGSIGRIFGIKFMQNQFGLSPKDASMYVGTIFIPCMMMGLIVSAFVCRRFKFDTKQCLIFVIICLSVSLVTVPAKMFIGCSNPPVAGVNVPYADVNKIDVSPNIEIKQIQASLQSTCNAACGCPTEIFQPVCGADGVTYISPCHAGCLELNGTVGGETSPFGSTKVYNHCQCVQATAGNTSSPEDTATSGLCRDNCNPYMLTMYIVLGALTVFFTSLVYNPLIFITLRIVDPNDRSVAVGLKSLVNKCLGFFPPPIYMGAIINSTCIYWQHTCGERGACWLYDIVTYRYAFFGTITCLQLIGILCYAATYYSLTRKKSSASEKLQESGCKTKETAKIEMTNYTKVTTA